MTEIRTESYTAGPDQEQGAVEGSFGEGSQGVSPFAKPTTTLTARLRQGFRSPPSGASLGVPIDRHSQFWILAGLGLLLVGAAYAAWTILQ